MKSSPPETSEKIGGKKGKENEKQTKAAMVMLYFYPSKNGGIVHGFCDFHL